MPEGYLQEEKSKEHNYREGQRGRPRSGRSECQQQHRATEAEAGRQKPTPNYCVSGRTERGEAAQVGEHIDVGVEICAAHLGATL